MRKLASDSIVYGLGSVANQALSFILLPLYTRYLSPADYGSLALIGSAGAILSFTAALGVHSGLIRIFFTSETPMERAAVAFTALAFAGFLAPIVGGVLLLSGPLLGPFLFPFDNELVLFRIAVLVFSLSAINAVALATLQAFQRPRSYIVCSVVGLIVSLCLTIVLVAWHGRGMRGVLEGQLAGVATQMGLALLASGPLLRVSFRVEKLKEMLAFAVPLMPTNFSAWLLGLADRFLLERFSTLTQVGLYALGFRFGAVVDTLFVRPFQQAWSPFLFSSLSQPNYRHTCARVLEYYAFVGALLVLLVSLFAGDVVRLIADASYASSEVVVFWIALGTLLRGSTAITVAGIHIERKTHYSAIVYSGAVILNLMLLRLLVPSLGTLGAALAMVATFGSVTIAFYVLAQRLHAIPYRPARIALLLGWMIGIYCVSRVLPEKTEIWAILAKIVLLVAFPTVVLLAGFFGAKDLDRARRLLKTIGRRSSD